MPTFVFSINRDESVDPHCHPESNQSICCIILRGSLCALQTVRPRRSAGGDEKEAATEFGARQKVAAQTASTTEARPARAAKDG
jgi:hypothetical protein